MTPLILATWLTLAAAPTTCTAFCPCTVPYGLNWRSARVMVPRERAGAGAIFLGRVVAADTLEWGTATWPPDGTGRVRVSRYPEVVRYRFAVTRQWKGEVRPEAIMEVNMFSTSCGRAFGLDSTYLVYAGRVLAADSASTTVELNSCGRVRRQNDAYEDMRLLGRWSAPVR